MLDTQPSRHSRVGLALLVLVLVFLLSGAHAFAQNALPSIKLDIDGMKVDREIFSIFILPGEEIPFKSLEEEFIATEVTSSDFRITTDSPGHWRFIAPEKPGRYQFEVTDPLYSRQAIINVFVLVPYAQMKGGRLEGYRIDQYPKSSFRGLSSYQRPKGFVRVDKKDLDVLVSPHFKLRQFLCKQKSGYPKFVVLYSKTLFMLEDFLKYVNDNGFKIKTFGVISAYRTPYYNRSIGNVPSSRHVYGDAMDLFIDRDGDGRLDDLDGNNKRNMDDVMVLYNLAVKFQETSNGVYIGGVGKYRPKSHHGGFVHIDSRGYRARW